MQRQTEGQDEKKEHGMAWHRIALRGATQGFRVFEYVYLFTHCLFIYVCVSFRYMFASVSFTVEYNDALSWLCT